MHRAMAYELFVARHVELEREAARYGRPWARRATVPTRARRRLSARIPRRRPAEPPTAA